MREIREEMSQQVNIFENEYSLDVDLVTLYGRKCVSLLPFDLQANPESNIPKESAKVRKTGTSNVKQNNNANMSASFISLNQLKAYAKGRARTRSKPV